MQHGTIIPELPMSQHTFDPENENRPYTAVDGVIIKTINGHDHILLGKRKNVAGAGNYYVPGGHIKMNESMADCLIREMKEECGVDIIPGKCLWIEENFEGPHHITMYYEAKLKDATQEPTNMEPDKCEGWEWYPVDNPPKPLWVTLGAFLKNYTKGEIKGI